MTLKTTAPLFSEQRDILKLLLTFASSEQKDLYEVACHARKRSNLLAVYDQGQLLGCVLLYSTRQYLAANCLLKEIGSKSRSGCRTEIKKELESRYPECMVFLDLKTYPV